LLQSRYADLVSMTLPVLNAGLAAPGAAYLNALNQSQQ
jgi:hypothetical protein